MAWDLHHAIQPSKQLSGLVIKKSNMNQTEQAMKLLAELHNLLAGVSIAERNEALSRFFQDSLAEWDDETAIVILCAALGIEACSLQFLASRPKQN